MASAVFAKLNLGTHPDITVLHAPTSFALAGRRTAARRERRRSRSRPRGPARGRTTDDGDAPAGSYCSTLLPSV